jgi:hypothetical protein
MEKKPAKKKIAPASRKAKSHPGRGGLKVSLWPLKPDHAMTLFLRTKPEDVKRQERAENRAKGRRPKPKAKDGSK